MFKPSHSSSEQHFQTKLDHSRNVGLAAEDSEVRVAVQVFRLKRIVGAYEGIGAAEENSVEDIKRFYAKLKPHALGHARILQQADVLVLEPEASSARQEPGSIAVGERCRNAERRSVEVRLAIVWVGLAAGARSEQRLSRHDVGPAATAEVVTDRGAAGA